MTKFLNKSQWIKFFKALSNLLYLLKKLTIKLFLVSLILKLKTFFTVKYSLLHIYYKLKKTISPLAPI